MKSDIQEALRYYESEVKELEEKRKEVGAKPEYGPEEREELTEEITQQQYRLQIVIDGLKMSRERVQRELENPIIEGNVPQSLGEHPSEIHYRQPGRSQNHQARISMSETTSRMAG
jgi:chromosome segregation ATPase